MQRRLFAVTYSRGLAWNGSRPMEQQEDWPAHAEFMNTLEREGFVHLGGPIEGTEDVLLVVRAMGEEEILARLSADPWRQKGLLSEPQIRVWTLRLGSIP